MGINPLLSSLVLEDKSKNLKSMDSKMKKNFRVLINPKSINRKSNRFKSYNKFNETVLLKSKN